ncbi:NUDIX domain-containing protein [Asanoa siamensis]|uniref:NUDIX hydrolase n=1 Tax=Asanoa siamensis TaxID=926357 RepID=A0ABQ4CMZ1_9ACTN|nr:NUDIX domain-containing protein [Asanoa siamensis]GIF72661.1 NUDIX hydrolase [Asanoa siamensis]
MRIPPYAFGPLYRIRKVYRRIVKPTTFGVKALIIHPSDAGRVLLVRHSYGNRSLWRLPGGGYRPTRETPEQAARRECMEELGLALRSCALLLEEHLTTAEGRQRYQKVVVAHAVSDGLVRNGEIAEARWVAIDLTDLPGGSAVSTWVRRALKAHTAA